MTGLVIYHGGCTDGVASAWAAHRAHPDWSFWPGVYQEDPPWHLIASHEPVYLVDFSYKRPVMEQIIDTCPGDVYVIDHHKTAEADLTPLLESGELKGTFFMDACGAILTHHHFHRDADGQPAPLPPLFHFIDARDRWVKPEPEGLNEIIIALRSYAHDPKAAGSWGNLMLLWTSLMKPEALLDLEHEGRSILRYHGQRVAQAIANAREWQFIEPDGEPLLMPAVNDNYSVASEAAGELAGGSSDGIACVFWTDGEHVTFSVRSRGDIDAGAWCEGFAGGGGHPGAAGFKVDSRHVDFYSRTVHSPKRI